MPKIGLVNMSWKKSSSKYVILAMVGILIISLSSRCSRKTENKERAAVSKSGTENKKISEVTEQEIRYCNETGKITTLVDKLNTSKTPETAKEVEAQIKKPAIFVEEYLQDNPETTEGAAALKLIASAYQVIDGIIGNQREQIAKAYKLLVELYPNSPYSAEANNWLKAH